MATLCPTCRTENSETANFCQNCAAVLTKTGGGNTPGTGASAGSATASLPPAATRTLEAPTWNLPTGSIFGDRYQIIELLGRGGMGRVYRALDTKTGEEVAIKLIRPDIAEDPRTRERFVNEIKLAHRISHRNIGKMYHLGVDRGLHFITLEYVPGEDLKSFIRRSRRLDISTVVAIAKQICSGLSEAHDAGIIHRDLKPGNIMIDKEGNAKILDFGIARAVGTRGVTAEGSVIGTPEYMSPEQVEGGESDRRSDIYSFGVILFEMVTGRLPFDADTPFAVAFKHQSEAPPRPEDLNPQTPAELSSVILRCLEKNRDKRYQTTEEVCRDLSLVEVALQATPLPASRRTKPTTRKTRPRPAVTAFPWKKALIPVLAFAGIMGLGVVLREVLPRATGAVHTIAVVGFENLTGEPSYDYLKKAIPNLLITSLEQSKYIDVTSWERLADLAGFEDRDVVTAGERDAWFDICRREGVDIIVLGSFTKADSMFATDAKVYDVPTKNLLKSAGARGEGVGSILRSQIDELSRQISQGAGLSERAAARHAKPITEVATGSMEAYEYLLKGQESFERYNFDEARQAFEKAVEKDPSFALPHFYLTRVYSGMAEAPKAAKALEQFKKLSKSSPGKGKDALYVTALSALVEKDMNGYVKGLREVIKADPKDKRAHADLAWFYKNDKKYAEAVAEFEKALAIDPNFGYALNLLAYTFGEMGEKDKALKTFDRYAAVQPGEANPLDSMGDLYFLTGEVDKARAKYQQALAIRPDFASAWKLAYLYAMDGDYDASLRWVDHIIAQARNDGMRADGHQWKGFYYSLMGRVDEALGELGTAESLAKASGNKSLADIILRDALWISYDWNRLDLFKSYIDRRLAYLTESQQGTESLKRAYVLLYNGLLDVREGRVAEAKAKLEGIMSGGGALDEKEKAFNEMASSHLKREILFAEGKYDEAIKAFADAPPVKIDLSFTKTVQGKNLPFQSDFVARAYLAKGEKDKALREYERLVSPEPGARENALIHPFSRLRLAALYEAKGDFDRAVEQLAPVVGLWNQADLRIPEVASARKKLQVLRAKTARPKGAAIDSFYPLPFIGSF
jgi:serine/threonine protein kinase/tetratricopeptide (TPR) repeat protein